MGHGKGHVLSRRRSREAVEEEVVAAAAAQAAHARRSVHSGSGSGSGSGGGSGGNRQRRLGGNESVSSYGVWLAGGYSQSLDTNNNECLRRRQRR